jgi:hypothetical protein
MVTIGDSWDAEFEIVDESATDNPLESGGRELVDEIMSQEAIRITRGKKIDIFS